MGQHVNKVFACKWEETINALLFLCAKLKNVATGGMGGNAAEKHQLIEESAQKRVDPLCE